MQIYTISIKPPSIYVLFADYRFMSSLKTDIGHLMTLIKD